MAEDMAGYELDGIRIKVAENGFIMTVERTKPGAEGEMSDHASEDYTAQSLQELQAMLSEELKEYKKQPENDDELNAAENAKIRDLYSNSGMA